MIGSPGLSGISDPGRPARAPGSDDPIVGTSPGRIGPSEASCQGQLPGPTVTGCHSLPYGPGTAGLCATVGSGASRGWHHQ
eukprot:761028-Hanusia_phi.AAC.5